MESILSSIKKLLGISDEDTTFDIDIIIHINSAFSVLTQLGVGPKNGFSISDKTSLWRDFIDETHVEIIKSYVYLKVKLLFDPPLNSAVIEAMEKSISEFEFRIQVAMDPKKGE